jgi:hypothetical protein
MHKKYCQKLCIKQRRANNLEWAIDIHFKKTHTQTTNLMCQKGWAHAQCKGANGGLE